MADRSMPDPTIRFWAKVAKAGDDECWIWLSAIADNGYGVFTPASSRGLRSISAHRYAWELSRGPIPAGLCVLHRCDNRACVNPTHLFLGTNAENTADMIAKGRNRPPAGEAHWHARATEELVREIRVLAAGGMSYSSLSRRFGLGLVTIHDIVKRKTWKQVP